MLHWIITVILLLTALPPLPAQANPFLGAPAETGIKKQQNVQPPRPETSAWIEKSAALQRNLQRQITGTLQGTEGLKSRILLLIISFLYGFVHALGPGHRKVVLAGYFIGEKSRPAAGIITGFLLAAAHAGSAILLVGGIAWLTAKSLMLSVNQAQTLLLPFSYSIIALLGLWMLLHGIMDYRNRNTKKKKESGLTGMVLSGLVPCPAASAIMLFAIATGTVLQGIFAVLAMSLGMGILLAGIGLAAVLFRDRISDILTSNAMSQNRTTLVESALHTAGGFFLLVFSGFLLFQSLVL